MIAVTPIIRMLLTLLTFAMPYVLLAGKLEPREGLVWRRACSACVALVFAVLIISMGVFTRGNPNPHDIYTDIMFGGVLIVSTLLIKLCRRCTVWTALFCAVFGYTMQNLGSNFLVLIKFAYSALIGPCSEITLSVLLVITACAAYALCYVLFIRRIPQNGIDSIEKHLTLVLVLAVMFINIIADTVIKNLPDEGIGGYPYCMLVIGHTITCLLTLYFEFEALVNIRLVAQAAASEHILEERERQYQTSREAMRAINARMHDMRHAVAVALADDVESGALPRETLKATIHELKTYDAEVRTGNVALDTVLTERRMICTYEGVTMTSVADGSCLGMMDTADIYALVGSLVDEAMACVRACDAKERSIAVSVKHAGGMAHLHIEFDCNADARATHTPAEATLIVGRYDGVITQGMDNGTAFVNVLIPM